MIIPKYNEKTGHPTYDNESRRLNKLMRRAAKMLRYEGPGGRRRKKYVLSQERPRYVILLAEAMNMQMQKKARGSESPATQDGPSRPEQDPGQ